MKTFLKIKRIYIYDYENQQAEECNRTKTCAYSTVVIHLRCGFDVVRSNRDYVNVQTGEVYEPLYDEFTNELIGFIG